MKKQLLLTLTIILGFSSFAKTITVDNTTSTGQVAMFANLQDAIDAATAGDILMIKGSATTYGSVTLDKQLTLIGEGYTNTLESRLTTIGSITLTTEAANSSLRNFTVFGFVGADANNLRLVGVNLTGSGSSSQYPEIKGEGWVLINCVYDGTYNGRIKIGSHSATFYNCFFFGIGQNNASSGVVNFHNCVITSYIFNSQFATFNNCILPLSSTAQVQAVYSTNNVFNNCLFENSILTQDTLELSGNELNGCTFDTDPQFENTTDYQLLDGSPAKNLGSDGTDLGLSGGFYPVSRLNGENSLTSVDKVFVETSVITPGSTLKLKVSAHQKPNE